MLRSRIWDTAQRRDCLIPQAGIASLQALSLNPNGMAEKGLRSGGWLAMALVFLAGLLVFLPGAAGNFIYDDIVDIRNTDDVFIPGAWPKLFLETASRLYRPVKFLAFYLDNRLFGWQPCGWHWQSFLWHALNCVLVYLLARRLSCSLAGAALGGLWFALHPIHTEAVVWISSVSSLLSTFGILAMILSYDHWRPRPSGWAAAGLLGGAFIGVFSKEDALMIFPLLALYEWFVHGETPVVWLRKKALLAPLLLLGAVAVVYLALRQSLISGFNQGQRPTGLAGWLSTFPVIVLTDLWQLIWPDPMCVDQPVNYDAGFGPAFWLSLLVLVGGAIFLLVRRPAWSRWQFAVAFFGISLIPVLGFIPINQPRADRFLYLPSVAGALAVGWLWDWAATRPRWRTACAAFLAASLFWFGWRSWDYSKTFLNDTVLWENVISVNPASYRAFGNLAAEANNQGQPQKALALVEKSLAVKPDYVEGWVIKAYSLELLGRSAEAAALYRQAIATGGEDPRWLYLLADLLQREKQYASAEQLYDRIAQIRPGYAEARLAAGLLALQMGEGDKAEAHFAAVLRADPGNQTARDCLNALHRRKRGAGS
ncbi:MAG: tetratricopeptide repeat protein [Verrucomicrobiota bacterium]|jgi:hypothetical protein